MPRKVLVILGHPSRKRASFCEALAETYCLAAKAGGHEVDYLKLARLDFDPVLHEGYAEEQALEPALAEAQRKIRQAEHLVFVYPLWQLMIPALLKGFMERTFTRGFAMSADAKNPLDAGLLKGKTARLIQTMGMPGFVYRLLFRAHGAKALKGILSFCGLSVEATYFGNVEDDTPARRESYLAEVRALGKAAR